MKIWIEKWKEFYHTIEAGYDPKSTKELFLVENPN